MFGMQRPNKGLPATKAAQRICAVVLLLASITAAWVLYCLAAPLLPRPGWWPVRRELGCCPHCRALTQDIPGCPSPSNPAVYDVLQQGSIEKAVPLTAFPSSKAQGFVHLGLQFRPLPGADEALAAARADMAGEHGLRGGLLSYKHHGASGPSSP